MGLGGSHGTAKILSHQLLVEGGVSQEGRGRLVGHNVLLGQSSGEVLPVAPRATGNLADIGHPTDDVQAVVQPLTATVVDRLEAGEDLGHIGHFKLRVDGGGYGGKELGHTKGPSVVRGGVLNLAVIVGEGIGQVNLRLIKEIFNHVISDADFNVKAFISVLDTMLAEKPADQGVLIVRRNRNVSKGTGALLSPNDWQLGASVTDKVVLTMYKMTGEKGWDGKQLWVPNIKLPDDTIYYDVVEDD